MNDIWGRMEEEQTTVRRRRLPKNKKRKKKTVAARNLKVKQISKRPADQRLRKPLLSHSVYDKRHTKYVINDTFSKHNITDVEQFIKLAFGKI